MEAHGRPYEIITVDDGSEDGTAAAAEEFDGPVKVLRHRSNRGYGAALKTGIRHARYNTICITDADGTYPNVMIPQLLAGLADGGSDMVVGARTGGNVVLPLVRRPAKWVLGRLASYVVGENIPDMNSGLRAFRRDVAERMFDVLPDGFSFTTTITVAMLTNGYLVAYEPIDYHARIGRSKIRPIRDTLNFVQLILKMGLYFAPLKVFLPLCGLLLLLGAAWALFTWFAFGLLADVSTLIITMAAIQIGAIGMLAELIRARMRSPYRED
jgi:glycosyltransferase involved in cell wall biosynthesis